MLEYLETPMNPSLGEGEGHRCSPTSSILEDFQSKWWSRGLRMNGDSRLPSDLCVILFSIFCLSSSAASNVWIRCFPSVMSALAKIVSMT